MAGVAQELYRIKNWAVDTVVLCLCSPSTIANQFCVWWCSKPFCTCCNLDSHLSTQLFCRWLRCELEGPLHVPMVLIIVVYFIPHTLYRWEYSLSNKTLDVLYMDIYFTNRSMQHNDAKQAQYATWELNFCSCSHAGISSKVSTLHLR